jgi:RNA polymerase sigma-70 factor (ECF subfamily)
MKNADHSKPGDLLTMARHGHTQAMGQLFELYRHYLGLLAQMGIDERYRAKIDPSDIVQQTFLEAHRDFDKFRGTTEVELMVWLRQTLAGNLADNVRRYYGAQQRDVKMERSIQEEMDRSSAAMDRGLIDRAASPSQSVARRERSVLLADALAHLTVDHREVLVLRHLKGLKFPEVARRMGRSVGSVQQLWARAIARLRQQLGDEP